LAAGAATAGNVDDDDDDDDDVVMAADVEFASSLRLGIRGSGCRRRGEGGLLAVNTYSVLYFTAYIYSILYFTAYSIIQSVGLHW